MSWAYDNRDKHLIHLRIDFHPLTVRSLPLFRINPVWCVICFVFCWTLLTTVIKFNFLNNKCTTIFIQQKRNLKNAFLPAHIFMSTYFHVCTLFLKHQHLITTNNSLLKLVNDIIFTICLLMHILMKLRVWWYSNLLLILTCPTCLNPCLHNVLLCFPIANLVWVVCCVWYRTEKVLQNMA